MIGRIIVAGGGTGGHLFPGIAVVEELRRRVPGLEVLFVGSPRGIEARVLPERGERVELIDVSPLKGRSAGELLRGLGVLPAALARATALLRRERPDVVLGVGGYASGPMLLAAATLGIPTAVLEQNARVGLTNKLLGRVVGRAYVTFPETAASFRAGRAHVCGNPVRRAFVDAALAAMADPDGFEARARRIFVLGGSQGAKVLNETVPEAIARAGIAERGIEVLHQTGAAMRDEVQARYDALGIKAEVVPFIDDMARAYASAAFVIARAGATTIAELCAVGRPSILVPYRHASDDHQGKNAEALARVGAALAIREDELTVEGLAASLGELATNVTARRTMADAARKLGRPDAAANIVDDLCAWLGCPPSESDDDTPARRSVSPVAAAPSKPPPDDGADTKARGRESKYRRPRARAVDAPHVVTSRLDALELIPGPAD